MTRKELLDALDTILAEEYFDFNNTDYPDPQGHQEKTSALHIAINIFADMSDEEFERLQRY